MLNQEHYVCEVCGRNANEVVLLQYPFTTVYLECTVNHVGEGFDNPEDEPFICLWCLHKDVEETDEEVKKREKLEGKDWNDL
jgi:hypothetical protein